MNIDKKLIEGIALEVGNYLLSNFGDLKVQNHKSDTHFDTIYDKKISDVYKNALYKYYPKIQFYSEEEQSELDSNKSYWMIDPIEGTSNFARSIPIFGTQLALIENNEVIFGLVYAPFFKEMYIGIKNHGAYCNDIKISPSTTTKLGEAIVSINKGTGVDNLSWWGATASKIAPHTRTIRNLGATGLEICYVASGKLDLHINHGSQNYDYAPGSLIAKESGALVLNHQGDDWNITDQDILIGNSTLVSSLLKNKYLK